MSTNTPRITRVRSEALLESFPHYNVLVIGDIMLDEYLFGDVNRISPEAPVPIVKIKEEEWTAGGAANVARNITSLSGRCTLVGVIGDDEGGRKVAEILTTGGVNISNLVVDPTYQTIRKTRIIGHAQQMLRLDKEKYHHNCLNELLQKIETELPLANSIIVSDYGKGVVSEELLQHVYVLARKHQKHVLVDPKPVNAAHYSGGAHLITPNFAEGSEMAGITGKKEDVENHRAIGYSLSEKFHTSVLLTLSEQGMMVFERGYEFVPVPIPSNVRKEVIDVSGAGDTVIASMGLCDAAQIPLVFGAVFSNYAAALVVGKKGTATTNPEELRKVLPEHIYHPQHKSIY